MIQIEFAQGVGEDLARIALHLLNHDAALASERLDQIELGLRVLQHHPLIGRRLDDQHRELVLGHDSHGYVAKYRYLPERQMVLITALRAQREIGYRR